MITLNTFPAGFGEQSYSPFCIKAIWLLNASGQDWQRNDMKDPRKMPHGKLPVITAQGRDVSGSDRIAEHLGAQGFDLWGDTDAPTRAIGHALIRMAEEHLYFQLVLDRWGNDAVWPILQRAYFDEIPAIVRGFVTGKLRKGLITALKRHGIGRLSVDERFANADADLSAIAELLAERPYLLEQTPSLPDFSVAAMLAAISACPVDTTLAKRVKEDAILMGYATRMKDQFDKKGRA